MRRMLAIMLGGALTAAAFAAAAILGPIADEPGQTAVAQTDYEVWAIDQSDSRPDGGGTLYVYQGADLTRSGMLEPVPEVIDLGGAARTLCLEQTGSAPRRPHMFFFNSTHTHAVLAFVASGHVLFMDAAARRPVACLDAGEQAHAAVPAPNDAYAVVANQNGKLLQRIRTDYTSNTFTLEQAATLDLTACRTPSGAPCQNMMLRPDNAPICPIVERTSRFTFVTLRGGGLFVVDATATPMTVVAEYDREAVAPNGCGGVETRGAMYVNAGGGTATTPFRSDLYAFPLAPSLGGAEPKVIFSQSGRVDSHGAALLPGDMLWLNDRAANKVVVVDTVRDQVANEFSLAGALSSDPAPDLIDVAPTGDWVFVTLRGPNPLTGNAPRVNNAVGATPGVGVIRVAPGGTRGELVRVARITRLVDGMEAADPHGIGVRRPGVR
jgi:hypothetical protein